MRRPGNPMIVRHNRTKETHDPVPVRRKHPPVWAYGVTTVPERRNRLLPRTLQSLRNAGFDGPRLFVDGDWDWKSWNDEFKLDVVCRYPRIRAYANWALALGELYARSPWADFYAIFQDDLVACKGLRQYLEHLPFPEKGYYNLYTFPVNQQLAPEGYHGFYQSNGKGLGALALVFDNKAVYTLLTHPDFVSRARHMDRGHRFIDGGVVTIMFKCDYREYVHTPSLVQHTGTGSPKRRGDSRRFTDSESIIGNFRNPLAVSFRGEEFDAMSLLNRKPVHDEA